MVIYGALSVTPRLPLEKLIVPALVASCFHCFAYVSNDVIDLELDKTVPSRILTPLVRGVITRRAATAFALCQIPVSLLLTKAQGAPVLAYAVLLLGFALMAIYNIWGKRIKVTLLTDISQAISWALLTVYGALVVGAQVNRLCFILALYRVVYICFINGVTASLRDLATDYTFGLNSTAILLGARFSDYGSIRIPMILIIYALLLQVAMTVLSALIPFEASRVYSGGSVAVVEGVVVSINVAFVGLLLLYTAPSCALSVRSSLGSLDVTLASLHCIVTFLLPAVGLSVSVPVAHLVILLGLHLAFLATQHWFDFARGLMQLVPWPSRKR